MERVENLIRLLLAPNVGNATIRKLLKAYGTSDRVLGLTEQELSQIPNIRRPQLQGVLKAARIDPRPELDRAAEMGVTVIAYDDPAYPPSLREALFDPPSVLYVRGELRHDDVNAFAIVGTRHASNYATEQARNFGIQLSLAGFTVVSGLARGVDSFAHQGALEAKGRTIAVIGCGLAHMYPPENRDLAAEIAQSGAVISEFPLETTPAKENFPRRNRIIAGMSVGVLVVEAPERSGALITAHQAAEMGRDVFAIPGRIDHPGAAGCHKLLKEGAILVRDIDDILDEVHRAPVAPAASSTRNGRDALAQDRLFPDGEEDEPVIGKENVTAHSSLATAKKQEKASRTPAPSRLADAHGKEAASGTEPEPRLQPKQPRQLAQPVTPEDAERILLDLLGGESIHIDELCRQSGLPVAEVSASLMVLELKRKIKQMPGKFFTKRS